MVRKVWDGGGHVYIGCCGDVFVLGDSPLLGSRTRAEPISSHVCHADNHSVSSNVELFVCCCCWLLTGDDGVFIELDVESRPVTLRGSEDDEEPVVLLLLFAGVDDVDDGMAAEAAEAAAATVWAAELDICWPDEMRCENC